MKKFVIDLDSSNQRIDKFLFKRYPKIPKSIVYKTFRKKDVKVNGKWVPFDYILKELDEINLFIKENILSDFTKDKPYLSNKPLDIIYEDDNILIINKPSGLLSQSNDKNKDCVVSRLHFYLFNKGEFDISNESSFSPSICNRLDINTCGLLIGAKNAQSLREINYLLKNNMIKKTYNCTVEGIISPKEGCLVGYLIKDSNINKAIVTNYKKEGSKKIVTHYKTLKLLNDKSYLEITLETGRFHQIRAHLSSIGHPILGDKKYGSSYNKPYFLVSSSISFLVYKDFHLSYLNKKTFSL